MLDSLWNSLSGLRRRGKSASLSAAAIAEPSLVACRNLDYSDRHKAAARLVEIQIGSAKGEMTVRFWERRELPYEDAPRHVQYCGAGRGRICAVFNCYLPDTMACHEAEK
jgi:hypothetical protein